MRSTRPIAVLAAATAALLIGGSVAAVDLRAEEREEQRRADAAAAERAAASAYLDAAAPILEKVFDHVQPIQTAVRHVEDATPSSVSVLFDVLTSGGARSAVAARGRELAALDAPERFAEQVAVLTRAFASYDVALAGVARLQKLFEAAPRGELDGFFAEQDRVLRLLDTASTEQGSAVVELYEGRDLPSLVDATGARTQGRQPVSRGAFLLVAGDVCGRAAPQLQDFPENPTLAQLEKVATQRVTLVEKLVTRLVGVAVPDKDTATVERTVRVPLRRFGEQAEAGLAVVAAIKAQDSGALQRAQERADASVESALKAADGLAAYGSSTCAEALRGE